MNDRLSVLVVDDSRDLLELLRINLNEMGLNPFASESVVDAIEILENTKIDLVITDLNMPHIGGLQLVKYISQHFHDIPILVITGYPNVQSAIDVMKLGVLEYLVKPFTFDELQDAVHKIIPQKVAVIEEEEKSQVNVFHGIIGASDKMQRLFKTIERTKNNRASVLIYGESGTGKEMVAKAIHNNSVFADKPFIAVNCGALSEQLLESELFGHVKGSFTGANADKIGLIEAASGGTLFLDEIGSASLAVQTKLLRAIQEKEITKVGATKLQKIEVRIISASNANLQTLISEGTFREDLYYRLNVVNLDLPPLREREKDIPLLINFFNEKFSKESSKKPLKFPAKVMRILEAYSWPGNVRELENFIHKMVVMYDDSVGVEEIPSHMKTTAPKNDGNVHETLAEVEKNHILKVLASTKGNKTKAAEILGIDRKTLREKIK